MSPPPHLSWASSQQVPLGIFPVAPDDNLESRINYYEADNKNQQKDNHG
jgi:hypothetical protein